jgi:co-chaperonin GroES (HSP10)
METSSSTTDPSAQIADAQTNRLTADNAKQVSKYLKRFEHASVFLRLLGDNILVERLPKVDFEQRSKGGIILPTERLSTYKHTHADDLMEFAIVIAVGPGQHVIGETGQLEVLPCTTKVGDIILLTDHVEWYSQFGHMADYEALSIGRMRDANVMMMFTDYKEFIGAINGDAKEANPF